MINPSLYRRNDDPPCVLPRQADRSRASEPSFDPRASAASRLLSPRVVAARRPPACPGVPRPFDARAWPAGAHRARRRARRLGADGGRGRRCDAAVAGVVAAGGGARATYPAATILEPTDVDTIA